MDLLALVTHFCPPAIMPLEPVLPYAHCIYNCSLLVHHNATPATLVLNLEDFH
jgi:hypothetical protein